MSVTPTENGQATTDPLVKSSLKKTIPQAKTGEPKSYTSETEALVPDKDDSPAAVESLVAKILSAYKHCLICEEDLDEKQMRRHRSRCKRCDKKLLKVWYGTHEDFFACFAGQI